MLSTVARSIPVVFSSDCKTRGGIGRVEGTVGDVEQELEDGVLMKRTPVVEPYRPTQRARHEGHVVTVARATRLALVSLKMPT